MKRRAKAAGQWEPLFFSGNTWLKNLTRVTFLRLDCSKTKGVNTNGRSCSRRVVGQGETRTG